MVFVEGRMAAVFLVFLSKASSSPFRVFLQDFLFDFWCGQVFLLLGFDWGDALFLFSFLHEEIEIVSFRINADSAGDEKPRRNA